jgi:quercetin dioxygenase-like cupin family protein
MIVARIDELPRIGSSWNFIGRDHEGVPFSFYLVEALPGKGAPLHRHDYDEVVLLRAGRARFVIDETTYDAEPGGYSCNQSRYAPWVPEYRDRNPGPD